MSGGMSLEESASQLLGSGEIPLLTPGHPVSRRGGLDSSGQGDLSFTPCFKNRLDRQLRDVVFF